MEDPNTIAILIPTEDLATRGSRLEHNHERYIAPTPDNRPFSKENTPCPGEDSQEKDIAETDDYEHRLKLTFDKPPKNVRNGYVFGWGPDCDIQLVNRENCLPGDRGKVKKVSHGHFSITFDAQRRVVLRDSSSYGTSVAYGDQAQNKIRTHFTWILFPDFKIIEVSIPSATISFLIKLGKHETCNEEFDANVDRLFPPSVRIEDDELAMRQLNVRSYGTSVAVSGSTTPGRGPIYLEHERIGKGAFGMVHRMINATNGDVYAGKYIDSTDCTREVTIMREIEHDRIVRFIDYCPEPRQLIIMEYLPLGNLHDAHQTHRLQYEETFTVLCQALTGLEYMHSRGFVHRDLKPANILLSSRSPLCIKLADLGLAKHNRGGATKFKTGVGTHRYTSPELWKSKKVRVYSFAVDIWSLGIVILELSKGLPVDESDSFDPEEWFDRIFASVQDPTSSELVKFLSENMLQRQAENRLSASECLEQMDALRLRLDIERAFQAPSTRESFEVGSAALTEQATVLATPSCAPKDTSKRPRSPDSSAHVVLSKESAIRSKRCNQTKSIYSQTYPIANASLWFDGQHGSTYESVLELLKDIRIDGAGASNPRTFGMVLELCRRLELLQITNIIKSLDQSTGRTILTAVTETKAFLLASLTSSDLANPVDELAGQILRIANLLVLDLQRSCDGQVSHPSPEDGDEASKSSTNWNLSREVDLIEDGPIDGTTTPTQALSISVLRNSSRSSANESDSWQTNRSKGLTYPSALSDIFDISGCTIPG